VTLETVLVNVGDIT